MIDQIVKVGEFGLKVADRIKDNIQKNRERKEAILSIKDSVDKMSGQINSLETKNQEIQERLSSIEGTIDQELTGIENRLGTLEEKIVHLEDKVSTVSNGLQKEMFQSIVRLHQSNKKKVERYGGLTISDYKYFSEYVDAYHAMGVNGVIDNQIKGWQSFPIIDEYVQK